MKHHESLLKIATLITVLPAASFCMTQWESAAGMVPETPCGTSRCAMGWGVHTGIAAPGLYLDGKRQLRFDYKGESLEAFHAVAKAYGIKHKEAQELFGPTRRTAAQEARLIRKFVREKRAA